MGYSTKEMNVFFTETAEDMPFKDNFKPLSDDSVKKLISALDHTLEIGMDEDVTMIVTFSSGIFLPKTMLQALVSFLETHVEVIRIPCINPDCITVLTAGGFVVTVRLFGSNKFIETEVGNGRVDDSFEAVEDLTQKVTAIERATPHHRK